MINIRLLYRGDLTRVEVHISVYISRIIKDTYFSNFFNSAPAS